MAAQRKVEAESNALRSEAKELHKRSHATATVASELVAAVQVIGVVARWCSSVLVLKAHDTPGDALRS